MFTVSRGFAHVKGNKDGSGRRLVFIETLRNGVCNVVQCCVGGVICFEAMLVGILFLLQWYHHNLCKITNIGQC